MVPGRGIMLPLRVGADGRLVRGDRVEALLALFRAMAATPGRSWPHAPWFGLREVFSGANPLLQDQHAIAEALNAALRELGITWAHVEAVSSSTPHDPVGLERRFELLLRLERQGPTRTSLVI